MSLNSVNIILQWYFSLYKAGCSV